MYKRRGRREKKTVEITCPKCHFSKQVAEEKIRPGLRWATCPRCHERFDFTKSVERSRRRLGDRVSPPWERRAEMGTGRGVLKTAREVMFSPKSFFRHTATEGGLREPLAFGILFGSIGLMLELFWRFLLGEEGLPLVEIEFLGEYGAGAEFLAAALLCPLAATAMICVTSLMVHLLLMAVRGGCNGFEATFRVVSYAQAAQGWTLIPYAGGLVATLWLMIVLGIGIREIHDVSYLRVFMALLIPVALLVAVLLAVGLSLFLAD